MFFFSESGCVEYVFALFRSDIDVVNVVLEHREYPIDASQH